MRSLGFSPVVGPGALAQVGRGHAAIRAVEDLAGFLDRPASEVSEGDVGWFDAKRFALEAVREATDALNERSGLPTSMLVGQIRSTAVGLLRASGM